ncbi:hypothetical protein E4T39_02708 [Aureobasidium subglaciale]|nr:hypothetical protein E4T39_02708 [Aureobasidium subglaciale]
MKLTLTNIAVFLGASSLVDAAPVESQDSYQPDTSHDLARSTMHKKCSGWTFIGCKLKSDFSWGRARDWEVYETCMRKHGCACAFKGEGPCH